MTSVSFPFFRVLLNFVKDFCVFLQPASVSSTSYVNTSDAGGLLRRSFRPGLLIAMNRERLLIKSFCSIVSRCTVAFQARILCLLFLFSVELVVNWKYIARSSS